MSKIEKLEDLIVWQKARTLTRSIYTLSDKTEFSKDNPLKDQIRRAAISITSNIAEGYGRGGNKEFIQFLSISKGSLYEARTQLYIAIDLNYISEQDFATTNDLMNEVGKLINAFINYLKKSEIKGNKFRQYN